MGSNIRSPIWLMAFYNPIFQRSIIPFFLRLPPSKKSSSESRSSHKLDSLQWSAFCRLKRIDLLALCLHGHPRPFLHGLKKCWLMDWFHINISTMFVAATFRLRHFRSGICRSGYRLWFVILFRNHSIRIPLVFNFTSLSNFSLFLFQAKVLHRRITNETNDNELNE